jgi:translation initiation factor 4G
LEKERRGAEERARQEEKEHTEAEEHVAWEAREKEEEERIQEARTQREVEEKVAKERAEQEWLRKLIEEEEARAKEEAERQRTAEENKIKAVEASENAHSLPYDAPMELTSSLPEEDEVDVDVDVSQPATIVTEEPALANESAAAPQAPPSTPPSPHIPMESSVKPVEMEQPRIDASLPPSPEQPQRRSGSSDFQTTTTDIAPPVPSALATARYIEDINRITYPQGIKSPKLELNVNTQKGKFRYDFSKLRLYHCAFVSQHDFFAVMTVIFYYSL